MRFSVVLDCLDLDNQTEFWRTALRYEPVGDVPGFRVLRPTDGEPTGPVVILQQVAEPHTDKNRMHVDLHPPLELGVPGLVDELEQLGARRSGPPVVDLLDEIGVWWQVMTDPEGNEFCVVADPGHPAPTLY